MTDRITKRREAIGEPIDMFVAASELLNKPGGMRERARRAIFRGQPDPSKGQSLCNHLDDGLYMADLYRLAVELGLPVGEQATKRDLYLMLSDVVAKSDIVPGLNENAEVSEGRMKKYMKYFIVCVNSDRQMRYMSTYLFTAESESEALYKFLDRIDELTMDDVSSLVLNHGRSYELDKEIYNGFINLNETAEQAYGHETEYSSFIKKHRIALHDFMMRLCEDYFRIIEQDLFD